MNDFEGWVDDPSVVIVVGGGEEESISEGLYELTRLLSGAGYDISGGLLGGEFGYGAYFENEVFGMHPYCYSGDTYVLTKRGWVCFADISISDIFAGVDPATGSFAWSSATRVHRIPYSGDMVHLKNKTVDMLVTPDHRFIVKDYIGRYTFKDNYSRIATSDHLTVSASWAGSDSECVLIGDIEFTASEYAKFMGLYLSEGSTVRRGPNWYQAMIAQINPEIRKVISDMLDSHGIPYYSTDRAFGIKNAAVASDLHQYGRSNMKWVPAAIMGGTKDTIRAFLDSYLLGDGTVGGPRVWKGVEFAAQRGYYTSSPMMVAQLCELLIKVGRRPTVEETVKKGQRVEIRGKVYYTNGSVWKVCENLKLQSRWRNISTKLIHYSGTVYDVTLAKNHTIFVKRNGKIWLGSNCWCERDDCLWCAPCSCPDEAYLYMVDGSAVDYDAYFASGGFSGPGVRKIERVAELTCVNCRREVRRAPNFWHKETKSWVYWYKYIGRSMDVQVNGDWETILSECINSLGPSGNREPAAPPFGAPN